LFFSGACFFFPAPAAADPGGTPTVRVGYMGYEYIERKAYTSADLRALGAGTQYYSWVDALPAPVFMAAEGVPLWNIIADAGIDPGSVQRYYFRASDGHEAIAEFTSDSLFYEARYWFPGLTADWDESIGAPGPYAGDGAQPAQTMIALREYHERFLPEPRPDLMYDAAGFRLVYGAAYVGDPYANFTNSVYAITHIDVQLVGSPPDYWGANDENEYIGADLSNETTGTGGEVDGDGKGAGDGDGIGDGEGGGDGGGGDMGDAEEIELGDGTVIRGREIKGSKVLMELNAISGGGGGKSDGDDPWQEYDIADESTPLKLPYEKESAAAVSGVVGLSFVFGAVMQGEAVKPKRRKGQ
jgi:hypothetical protein